jgi:nitroreductase
MKNSPARRTFLKSTALIGGGLLLVRPGSETVMAQQEPPTAVDAALPPANDTLKTIQSLRTIHGNFVDKPIPDATIDLVLQASIRAANAFNMQSYSIVVVKDRKMMKDVCTYEGSCMLLYCVDYTRLKASAELLGHAYYPDTIVDFVTASINTALAAQTAAIAARSLGIDYLITNGIHRGDMERVWRLLELPQTHCFPLLALLLGYPTEEPLHKMGRLDGPGVIHQGRYYRLAKDELQEINRKYDDKRLHLGGNEKWDAEGYKHYLDWVFTKARPRAKPTGTETQMFRLLKRSGFIDLQKA